MNRIKIAGGLVFFLSLILVFISITITSENIKNTQELNFINEQKSFTQEISKSIFYIYREGNGSSKGLDEMIRKYIENSKIEKSGVHNNHLVIKLWNLFYFDVQKFRTQQRIVTGYNPIITAKLVNRIYHNNVLLLNEFNKVIKLKQRIHTQKIAKYKKIEYALFTILISLLLYLFTQLREILSFIQKFSKTSKNIIQNATIQGLEPIDESEQEALKEAIANHNHLVEKINNSIEYATKSMEHGRKSLEEVAENIEDFMELVSLMQDKESHKLFEKEDAVIDSLETIMKLRGKLGSLKKDLEGLLHPNTFNDKEYHR